MNDFEKLLEMFMNGENKESEEMKAAKQMRKLYEAFVSVGFAEDEAFELVITILSGGLAR